MLYPITTLIISFVTLLILFNFAPCVYWWRFSSGKEISIPLKTLFYMQLRKVDLGQIISAAKKAKANGIDADIKALEAHHLAGGNIGLVIDALILANKEKVPLTFERAVLLDIAEIDMIRAITDATSLIRISYPAKDQWISLQLRQKDQSIRIRMDLTLRLNLDRLIGGEKMESLLERMLKEIEHYAEQAYADFTTDTFKERILGKRIDLLTRYDLMDLTWVVL